MRDGDAARREKAATEARESESYRVEEAALPVGSLASPVIAADADSDDEQPEVRVGPVDERQHGERLDKAVVAMVPEFSRSHLQELIKAGWVQIDGAPQTSPAHRVRAGQALSVTLQPTAESRAYRGEALPLTVVYEDDAILVIDKAAGMVVHPAAGNWSGTVLNALLGRDPAAATLPRAGIVHRLDKDTSGLMVVGRTLAAVTALVRAIAARDVHRRYLAIAHGAPPTVRMSIEAPIGRDPHLRTRMAVLASGKAARTDIELVASVGGVSALRCTLHTGRTHQIRVHLASRGMPLLADRLYGGAPALGMARQALHAARRLFHGLGRARAGKGGLSGAGMPGLLATMRHSLSMGTPQEAWRKPPR